MLNHVNFPKYFHLRRLIRGYAIMGSDLMPLT
jgi:hypothetical protein